MVMIAMAGPKSLKKSRKPLRRYGVAVARLRFLATINVPSARIKERKAASSPLPFEPKDSLTLLTASTMNITEIRAAKISSVNLVKNRISALASVNAQINNNTPDQIPTHAQVAR